MKRKLNDCLWLVLKGMGMGAADVVPGVSGGTIAFIAGIYDELIDSIKSVNLTALRLLVRGRVAEFWRHVNGTFLLSILTGIGISVFSLAKIITWLLVEQPVLVWSFFFGLVLASTWSVARSIKGWDWKTVAAFVCGTAAAWFITAATPAETPSNLPFVFVCGAIAICAMILPGISGSFILVLLGKYFYIMEAVKTLDLVVLGVFIVGASVGITTFSRLLSYALKHVRNLTLAVLSGFMLGSLNKVWPWKVTVATYTDSHGVLKPLVEENILPDRSVPEAVVLMLVGFFLVYGLERLSARRSVRG